MKDNKKYISEGYVVDVTPQVINGYEELKLVVGNKYEVNYGIHQGIYEYVGKTISDYNCSNIDICEGQHLFRSCKTGKITFGYYGKNSPFEFTRIVKAL